MEKEKYIYALSFFDYFIKLPVLSIDKIILFEEPYRMMLYAYYNHFDNFILYNLEDLNKDYSGIQIYLFAIYSENIKIMKYMEKLGFDIYSKNRMGESAYLKAAAYGNIKMMKYLEKKGPQLYNDAYYIAAINGNVSIMKYLDNKGLNKDKPFEYFNRIYLSAIHGGHLKVLKYLDAVYTYNYTHITEYYIRAICCGQVEIMKYLYNMPGFIKPNYIGYHYIECLFNRRNKSKKILNIIKELKKRDIHFSEYDLMNYYQYDLSIYLEKLNNYRKYIYKTLFIFAIAS